MPTPTPPPRFYLLWLLPLAGLAVAAMHLVVGMLFALGGAPMLIPKLADDPYPFGLLLYPVLGALASLARFRLCAIVALLAIAAHAVHAIYLIRADPAEAQQTLDGYSTKPGVFVIVTFLTLIHGSFIVAVAAVATRALLNPASREYSAK